MKRNVFILVIILVLFAYLYIDNKKAIEKCTRTGKTEFECSVALNR